MNPIVFALRRPVTVMMIVLALGLGGAFSIVRMQKDIFPSLNQPVLYVIHNYGGMDPKQIEGLITNVYELFFQYINGIEHVESRSVQSMNSLEGTMAFASDFMAERKLWYRRTGVRFGAAVATERSGQISWIVEASAKSS